MNNHFKSEDKPIQIPSYKKIISNEKLFVTWLSKNSFDDCGYNTLPGTQGNWFVHGAINDFCMHLRLFGLDMTYFWI